MSAAYSVKLDQETARYYADKGATILLLEVPEATHVAFDHQSFVVGPKFKGVKMVPPGPHLVSYNAASRTGDFAPTVCFFPYLATSQVLIRRWDAKQELLIELQPDEAEAYTAGVRHFDFDQNLAPYNLHAYQQWQQLSNHISQECIQSLSPLPSGNISITAEADPALLTPATPAEEKLYTQLQEGRNQAGSPGQSPMEVEGQQQEPSGAAELGTGGNALRTSDLKAQEGVGRCYYTQLPRLVKVPGMTPHQLTALNLDKTAVLEDLIQRKYQGKSDGLLGELQFSFLAFLMGHSLEGSTNGHTMKDSPSISNPCYPRPSVLPSMSADCDHRLVNTCDQRTKHVQCMLTALLCRAQKLILSQLRLPKCYPTATGFAQWKAILHLMLGCQEGPLRSHVPLFVRFVTAVQNQLQHSLSQEPGPDAAPAGTEASATPYGMPVVEELLADSFLRHLFGQFFQVLHEEAAMVQSALKAASTQLHMLLRHKLDWQFHVQEVGTGGDNDDDDDEYAPVIVQLDDAHL